MKRKMFLLLSFACLLSSQAFTQNPCDLSTGLTGYFPFKGNANDASLTAMNGIEYNLAPTAGRDGIANSAFHFNGTSSWVDCGTDNRGVTTAVTVCVWVRTTNTTSTQWVAGKYRYEEDKGYGMVINGPGSNIGQVGFGGRDGTSGSGPGHQSGWSTKKVNDGEWHCVVGIAANSSWEIYVDGSLENSAVGSTIGGMATSLDVPFTIGYQIQASPIWMDGDIDDVRVYNRRLTQSEIDCFCATAPCETLSASGLTGYFPFKGNAHDVLPSQTLIDGIGHDMNPITGHDGVPNSAFNFNGKSSWTDCGTDNRGVTDEVAVCAWVRTTNKKTGQWVAGKYRYEEDKGYALIIGDGFHQNIGQVGFGGRDGTSGSGPGHGSGWSDKKVNDGEWHCLVGMAANQSWEIYVDGALENSMAGSTIGGMATSLDVPFTIGYQIPDSPIWMDGDIDNVRVYNRRLTQSEIECFCYTAPCEALLAPGLAGHFPLDGNADDISSNNIDGTMHGTPVPTFGHGGNANKALHFNASSKSDWIDCGKDNRGVTDEVAVCAWVRTTNDTSVQWVAGKYRYEEDKGYGMVINGPGANIGQVGFGGRDGTSGSGPGHQSGWSTKKVNDGEWHCVVGIAANSSWEIYVDGTLKSSAAGSTIGGMATSLDVPFTIGFQIPASPVWMDGDIDGVRLYNRRLTPYEIECFCSTGIVSTKNALPPTEGIRLFPNPANDQVSITWENAAPQNLRLIDLFGRSLRSLDVLPNADRMDIPLEGLPPGTYFLIWQNDTGEMRSRAFVKM